MASLGSRTVSFIRLFVHDVRGRRAARERTRLVSHWGSADQAELHAGAPESLDPDDPSTAPTNRSTIAIFTNSRRVGSPAICSMMNSRPPSVAEKSACGGSGLLSGIRPIWQKHASDMAEDGCRIVDDGSRFNYSSWAVKSAAPSATLGALPARRQHGRVELVAGVLIRASDHEQRAVRQPERTALSLGGTFPPIGRQVRGVLGS
jgi:hypothetical protein